MPANFIDKTVVPYCIYNTPFKRFNLTYVLEKGDVEVKKAQQFAFANGTFPTETTLKAHIDNFDTIAPTTLYLLAAISAFFATLTLPKGFCGLKWSFGRKLINLLVTMVAFAMIGGASGLWTFKASAATKALSSGDNAKYFAEAQMGTSFLAMTWLASIFMFVAMLLCTIEFAVDKWSSRRMSMMSDRRSFVKIAGSDEEAGGDRNSKTGVQTAAWELRDKGKQPAGRVEMPGYEPLRA
jgi:hypothetical protein